MRQEASKYMLQAIKLAEKARGTCSPNPFVGALIVKQGQIIAQGCTQAYGGDHAEVQALKQAGSKANGAEMYVTLEPCAHYGKTPPCALAIIKAGIKKVFVGITDPNPLVAGKGIAMLQDAGIEVHCGFLEANIEKQLEYFLCYINKQRPFVTLKTALSLDGKYAANDGSSRWITDSKARHYVHRLRCENDVVLCGINTILMDDPLLNVRLPQNEKQPLRAVLDPQLRIPLQSKFVSTANLYPSLVFCAAEVLQSPKAKQLLECKVQLCGLEAKQGLFAVSEVLHELYKRKHYAVLLEAGSGVATSFLQSALVDKCMFFYGSIILGGTKSYLSELKLPSIGNAIKLNNMQLKKVGSSFILSGYPLPSGVLTTAEDKANF